MAATTLHVEPAKGVPYFTPAQEPPSGTLLSPAGHANGGQRPKLFTPLTIRGKTFQNRVVLSPMAQYSASPDDGRADDWHLIHLGSIISRGPGLSFFESTSVTPEGRSTPQCPGLWEDAQIEPLKRIVDFAHCQGQKIAIQLGHAGRKASGVAPFLTKTQATSAPEVGGFADQVIGPSPGKFSDGAPAPTPLTPAGIQRIIQAYVDATQRALRAGFDVVEIHAAHGYLFHEFLSPVANKRTDDYGGSLDNRTRFLRETATAVRAVLPDDVPLFVRVSATDWFEFDPKFAHDFPETWTVAQSAYLAGQLADLGVDLIDVSSGGIDPHAQTAVQRGPAYQAPFAQEIKKAVGDRILVSAVGGITTGPLAEELLQSGLDAVFVGRVFQKNPGLLYTFADELGVDVKMAEQYAWGFGGRGTKQSRNVAEKE